MSQETYLPVKEQVRIIRGLLDVLEDIGEPTSEGGQKVYESIEDILDRAEEAVTYAIEFYQEYHDWKEAG